MIEALKYVFEHTDPLVLLVMAVIGATTYNRMTTMQKDIDYINKAVNDRGVDEITMSQEVKAIFKKLGTLSTDLAVHITELSYVKKELDAHRKVDEKAFLTIVSDLTGIRKEMTNLTKKNAGDK